MSEQNIQPIGQNPSNQSIQTAKKPKVNYWMISTSLLFIALVFGGIWFVWIKDKTLLKNQQNISVGKVSSSGNIISKSPSGKYLIRSLVGTNETNSGFEIVDDSGFQQFELREQMDAVAVLDKRNFAWNHDESVVAITYVPFRTFPIQYLNEVSRNAYLILWPMKEDKNGVTGKVDKMMVYSRVINLGSGAYYGNDPEQVFYPVVSPDGKYIAIQTDLIHKISIYSFQGLKIEDLMTKYADTPLFSPEMFQLENGKYNPLLEYKWSETGDGVLYRFLGTEKYYEVKITSSDWKTYTNPKYGFSFKYPGNYFQYQQDEADSGIYLAPSKGNGGNGPKFLSAGDVWLDANVDTYKTYSSFDDYFNLVSKENSSLRVSSELIPEVIGGANGYKVTYESPNQTGSAGVPHYEGLILKDGRLYKFTLSAWTQKDLDAHKDILDQILSTFKFTD